jgi:hypothetical protein
MSHHPASPLGPFIGEPPGLAQIALALITRPRLNWTTEPGSLMRAEHEADRIEPRLGTVLRGRFAGREQTTSPPRFPMPARHPFIEGPTTYAE